jgi:hypothetical protein
MLSREKAFLESKARVNMKELAGIAGVFDVPLAIAFAPGGLIKLLHLARR